MIWDLDRWLFRGDPQNCGACTTLLHHTTLILTCMHNYTAHHTTSILTISTGTSYTRSRSTNRVPHNTPTQLSN